MSDRIYLSAPHLGELEQKFVQEAFDTNWIAPLGPNVDAFEREFADYVGVGHAAALSSGTAALHLALQLAGVQRGDRVLVSDLTFVASASPITYLGAEPVFIDAEYESWNLDPEVVREALETLAGRGTLPRAIIVVHLYGQCANLTPILQVCQEYGVTVIEDAAEALGSFYHRKSCGSFGASAIFSFNGNKIITTSGGGMLVSEDEALIQKARKLATQARDPAPHYQHSQIGYNYRLSNVLAGIGRGQLMVLDDRVARRRQIFARYEEELGELPGVDFQPEAPWGKHTRWLTCLTIDPEQAPVSREEIRLALEAENIEARPVWKPMHMQPVFQAYEIFGGDVGRQLFEDGLCLPSGSGMTDDEQGRVIKHVRALFS